MLTLPNLLKSTAQNYGKRRAIIDESGNLTWAEYVEQVTRTASTLRALGLSPGDRFATLCRNSVAHARLLLAGYWSGTVPVPLNFRLAPSEIAAMLEDAGCARLFLDDDFLPLLAQPPLAPWRDSAVRVRTDATGQGSLPTLAALDHAARGIPAYEGREADEALLLYTGGTTGRGKGVRLTHRNIVANALQLARVMSPDTQDVYLHVSPMFHSTDLKATVVTMFGGAHVYLSEFSAAGVLDAISRYGVTIASLVPTMIISILKEEDVGRYDLSRLRLISYGTAPMDEQWLRKAMDCFGHVGFHQCYGLTETSPYVAILDEASHRLALQGRPELLRAAGRPLPGTLIRLLDESGKEVPPGDAGEIVIAGPQVAAGYHNRPEENEAAFRNGWLHTGDIGRLDEDGYLHVLDRKKDMVITGGENVYTREVESVLQRHPSVSDAAVLGIPDDKYGEALLAVIVPAGVCPEPDELIAFCRNYLGGYKIPRRFMFTQSLPRSPLGKVRKHELRNAYLDGGKTT